MTRRWGRGLIVSAAEVGITGRSGALDNSTPYRQSPLELLPGQSVETGGLTLTEPLDEAPVERLASGAKVVSG